MTGPVLHAAPSVIPGGMLAFMPVSHDAPDGFADLDSSERALALTMPQPRRDSFVAGRIALRAALRAVRPALAESALLQSPRGAPQLPSGTSGSVSHKRTRAVALVAPYHDEHVGVDLEMRVRPDTPLKDSEVRRALARRILTSREQANLHALDDVAHRDVTLLHFALKEAVYKAIDPFVERFVPFTEVEIDINEVETASAREVGVAHVTSLLPECKHTPLDVRAAWWLQEDWIVATAVAGKRGCRL